MLVLERYLLPQSGMYSHLGSRLSLRTPLDSRCPFDLVHNLSLPFSSLPRGMGRCAKNNKAGKGKRSRMCRLSKVHKRRVEAARAVTDLYNGKLPFQPKM